MTKKTVITLHQLEELLAEKKANETGLVVRPEYPIELSPAYFSFCKRSWGAWERQQQKRQAQLAELELAYTHEIDYYNKTGAIRPF